LDARSGGVSQVPFNLRAEGLALLVIDSRAPHAHADGEYANRRRTCEEAAAALGVSSLRDLTESDLGSISGLDEVSQRRVRHVVTENARVLQTVALLEDGRIREIGPMLTASHASLRDDYEVSVPEIEALVAAAEGAGALGARIVGGGFGGSVLALVPREALDDVAAACRAVPGGPGPTVREVAPAPGARRDL
jgi:galactokinase